MKTYAAEISTSKKDEHSFLVALIPALSIPSEFQENSDIMESDCAVIAANHCNDGKNLWAYVHLECDEKQTIGNALRDSCAEMGRWYWCNLYAQGEDETAVLRARVARLEDAGRELLEACEAADIEGDLSEHISGDMMFNFRRALEEK